MPPSARKERERQARERLILDTSRRLLAQRGYLGLNMDAIAEAIEYSKGTIYQHFSSKEDLIAALCTDTASRRLELFRKASSFGGRTRERVLALGIADAIFAARHPDHAAVESILDVASVNDKISDQRRDAHNDVESRTMDVLTGIVRDAIEARDLELPEGWPLCSPMYGLWTQSIGHRRLAAHSPLPPFAGIDLGHALWRNYSLLLDGYGWRPLSSEHDYADSARRIAAEVFAEPGLVSIPAN